MKRKFYVALAALAMLVGLFTMGDVGAASLQTRVSLGLSSNLTSTVGLTSLATNPSVNRIIDLANGVALNQADSLYTTQAAITTGATLSIDVKGSLLDPFGAAFTPAKLKVIYIFSSSTNTTDLTLFGDANSVPILNTAATTSTLKPGGMFMVVQPSLAAIPVTAGTGDIIKIVNASGATANVDIILIGTSS